jgi:probable HAF family extracellular repeat protein
MHRASLLLRSIVLAAGSSFSAHGALLYTPEPIPANFYGNDLNDHNEAVGFHHATSTQSGEFYAGGTNFAVSLGGNHYFFSTLNGINNNHFAVGQMTEPFWVDPVDATRALIVHPDPKSFPKRYLGSLVGPDGDSNARDLNDFNTAVGDSETASGATHAVRYETNGMIIDLGTLGGKNSSAYSINNRGDVVGHAQSAEGYWRAFLIPAGGAMIDLGTLGGNESHAYRINNRGQIVGEAQTAAGTMHAFLYSDGKMQDLGTIYGANSVAYGINDHGVIVGGSSTAFIKFPGEPIQDLRNLVFVRYDELLTAATAINNSGVILGRFSQGFTVAFGRLFKPGHLTAELRGSEYHVTFSAPHGTRFRLDRSTSGSLIDWMPILTNTLTTTEMTHRETPNSRTFFRALIIPAAN